jgi:hypothetical protein|tara:strand:+ start:153 stop:428 length:276 start_codon:yes stop_codon:yes gene_type:complete
MTNTNANASGAGFVHGAYSVLNNSAVQEANQKQVGQFLIGGSDSKSIAHNYSREDLIQQEDQSPGTAMNLNENSNGNILVDTDPTQIIFIQ